MTTTSAPNRIARVLAVLSILLGGLCGGLIGYVVTDLQCHDGCPTGAGVVGVFSAIACAAGVAVVAVLALRAAAEWNQREARERAHQERGLT
ncbi:MAG: hypothetical protein F4Y27_04580 [Acidimicrobiaceae bacterium]|nr:hypothetical protein [Acidimicrobiaceae bacterium]MXW61579.1 hypothetical protein [Acidimicrobiaceae bacterium]MXW75501.1 hypothetical protein [Acidimicrobiaceae bacterium]MYA73932.1 hypothetical protein [Acidimicrobiaceae bacterium]MYC42223.1 hypothetical protein [Acidimicrobiaceae bacterium]